MQILRQQFKYSIGDFSFACFFSFHAVVDSSVVFTSRVVESDWYTFRRVLHVAIEGRFKH